MKNLTALVALVCCVTHATAQAEFKDGNKLHSELTNTGVVFPTLGMGYIMGVADALGGITHCMPENVTAGQLRDMVKNYLDTTPAVRHLPASSLVVRVLAATWPCAVEKKKGAGV